MADFPPLATLADLQNYGVVSTAFGQINQPQILAQLQSASSYAYAKMSARYSLPLLAWDVSITQAVVQIAAYQIMVLRGFDPNSPGDASARDLWMAAREFFDAVERQHAHPLVTESPAPTTQAQPQYAGPLIASGQQLLGWMPCPGYGGNGWEGQAGWGTWNGGSGNWNSPTGGTPGWPGSWPPPGVF